MGIPREPQQRVASFRLLQIDGDAAFAAIGIEEHAAHARAAAGTDLPDDVAFGAFHLDDVRAHIREDLRGVGPHQNGGQVENRNAAKRAHGRPSQNLFIYVHLTFSGSQPNDSAFCAWAHALSRILTNKFTYMYIRPNQEGSSADTAGRSGPGPARVRE